ncbi:uncharacterized protein LOC125559099 [Nematostella vectensis]|uniref:uncharacterized protein LOC125559099 n=1 Tax=Nematostella vectensis TaxID=45351 RepID=UPI0020776A3A|nr:uncharacterized protein LOC125559099 [Nematostella vectensis]
MTWGGHYQATFSDLCLVVLCPTLAGDPEVRATIDLSNVTQDRIQAAVAEAEARLALTTESIDRQNRRDQQDREYEEGLRRDQERVSSSWTSILEDPGRHGDRHTGSSFFSRAPICKE